MSTSEVRRGFGGSLRNCSSLPAIVVLALAFVMLGPGRARGHVCGDGQFDGTDPNVETCDASASPSFLPSAPSSHGPCRPPNDPCGGCHYCGDGIVQPCEECDDGNADDNDGCRNDCTLPTTTTTTSTTEPTTSSSTTTVTPTTTTTTPSTSPNTTAPTTTSTTGASTTTTSSAGSTTTTTAPCVPVPENCHNMVDDDCDGLIDCLDPDCVCKPARKDPTILTFVQSHLDRFRSQATLDIAPLDLGSMQVGVLLTNPNGVIYRAVLAPGDLSSRANGTIFQFRDPAARTGHGNPAGIYNLQIKQHRDQKGYTIKVEAYADLSRATDPMMRIQFYLGDNVFITTPAPWTQTPSGWRAPKDH